MLMISYCIIIVSTHDHSVFFTSVTWDEDEVGFTQVPGGEQYQNKTVLAWHFYKPPQAR